MPPESLTASNLTRQVPDPINGGVLWTRVSCRWIVAATLLAIVVVVVLLERPVGP